MAVVGIQPSIWVCKYHKYYKQNICSVHLKLIKVKNNFGDFSGNPQKLPWIPRKFGLSKSPKYVPKPRNCFPRPHPENRRFSGFFPRKNPKNLPSPVPTPSPKILKKFPRPHPVPELRGGGRGSPGIGVTIAHSNTYYKFTFLTSNAQGFYELANKCCALFFFHLNTRSELQILKRI